MPQKSSAHFFNGSFSQFAQLEWPERHADQTIHRETKIFEDTFDFAILTLTQSEGEPNIIALLAIKRRFNRTIMHIINSDAFFQRIERRLIDFTKTPHTITT